MAVSCPNLSLSLGYLPRSAAGTAPRRPPVLFQQPVTPRRTFTLLKNAYRQHHSSHVASATSTDGSLASLVGQLERDAQAEPASAGQDGLAGRWREIHGSNNWEGLLNPMDPVLRRELIRYGEFAQACYDAFDYDRFSSFCGSCKHPPSTFFQELGVDSCGYQVSRYLYATSTVKLPNFTHRKATAADKLWSETASFIGFVAVSTDEETARIGRRDITVAWRGTVTRMEWVADLTASQQPLNAEGIPCPDPGVKVEKGFVELYNGKDTTCRFCKYSAREQVLSEVRKLVDLYTSKGEEVSVTVTGHSLGGALAVFSAFDIAETKANVSGEKRAPVCVFSFSGPRVGNHKFKERFEKELGIKALRVVNVHDGVPKVPGVFFNESFPPVPVLKLVDQLGIVNVYTHVGVELTLDHTHSPFLKNTLDPACSHSLEAHLHLLDGYHGPGRRFEPGARDPALVNKDCDFLKDEHMVPPGWRQDENKGMVKTEDGRWVLPSRRRQLEDHPEDTHHHLQHLGVAAGQQQ